jgi:hypothetical protein
MIEVSTSSTIPTEPTTTTTIQEPVTTTLPVTTTTILVCNPIIIPKFELIPEWRKILVHWNTSAEPCVSGFRVFRSANCSEDEFVDISGLIPAQGTESPGSSYCFDDDNVKNNIEYCYKIEISYIDGSKSYSSTLRAETVCSDPRFQNSISIMNICEGDGTAIGDKSCSEYFAE